MALLGLLVHCMTPAAGTILGKFHPLRVVLLILGSSICSLLSLHTRKIDDDPSLAFFLRHFLLLDNLGEYSSADCSATLSNGESLSHLHGHRIHKLQGNLHIVAGHR